MSKKENLYCYIRVSSDGQRDDGGSLEVQREWGQKVSKQKGMKYVELYEGSSSTMIRSEEQFFESPRPIYSKLKDMIRSGEVKHLWVWSPSRLHRDSVEEEVFRRFTLIPNKVKLYVGQFGGEVPMSTPNDILNIRISSIFDQQIKENVSYLSRMGKIRRSNTDGHLGPFMGGTINFGYRVNKDKFFEIDKEESKIVRQIFKMYSQGTSLKDIKIYLDTNNIKPRRSKSWSLGSIHKMLLNRFYVGEHKWTDKKTEETYPIVVPRIVTHSLFNRVQKKLTFNQKNKGSNFKKHDTLLCDFLECYCGQNITGHVKLTHNTGPKKYYYCHSKENKWKGVNVPICDNRRSLNMDRTDELVKERVKDIVEDSSFLKEKFKNDVLSQKGKKEDEIEEQKRLKQVSIDNLNKQLDVVFQSMSKNEVNHLTKKTPKQVYVQVKKMLDSEMVDLEDRKSVLVKEIDDLDTQKDWVDWIGKYSDEITNTFSDVTSDYLKGVINKIVVSPKMGKGRDKDNIQLGHELKIHFRYPIVNDSIEYNDPQNKRKGYKVINGKKIVKDMVETNKGGRPKKKQKKNG